ncbi:MAG: hypothetical protein ACRDFA_08765 [bacterium]
MAACVLLVALTSAAFGQEDEQAMIGRITAIFPGTEGEIQAMRDDDYGWGMIIMVLFLSQESGQSVGSIRGKFEGGMGLGEIAKELGVDPGELGRAVAHVMSGGRSGAGDAAAEERGKPDWTPGPPAGVPGKP